jgi:D-arabinose 1-dehydrogenase-like Zn-dependent alcohol dehydrogenase
MSLPKTYKRAAFKEVGGSLVIENVPLEMPGSGEILLKVEACGVCHSDVFAQQNFFGFGYPMVPGHEIVGRVAAVGEGVEGWQIGERAGGAWHGGHCGSCEACGSGNFSHCQPYVVNGVTKDGGCKIDALLPTSNQGLRANKTQMRNTAWFVHKLQFAFRKRLTLSSMLLFSVRAPRFLPPSMLQA